MIQVEMVDDIRKYEPKLIGPFSKRQSIAISIGVVLGLILMNIIPLSNSTEKFAVFIFSVVAVGLFGWITMDGTPLEIVLVRMIYLYFLTPSKRKYASSCTFKTDMRNMERLIEKDKLSRMSPRERKAYEKEKAKKNIITYSDNPEFREYR